MAVMAVPMTKSLDKPELTHYLDNVFFETLPNLNVKNRKLLVVFSGGNGVGKSSLAKRLRAEFQGLLLENDAVRELLVQYEPKLRDNRELMGNILWEYMQGLYAQLPNRTTNGLVIRDAVIDWSFEKILPIFEAQGYELFVVRFELSREKRREMLQRRGGKAWISVELLEGQFANHEEHARRFLAAYTPGIILRDETVFDYDSVVNAVRQRLDK